jgi:hypothetical protein
MANDKDTSQRKDGASNDRSYGERDPGAADPAPAAGDMLNFDDDEVMSGRGNNARTGGTWAAEGADSGRIAPPREILSDRNGPSDSDNGGKKPA